MAGFNDRRPNRDEQREERRREAARHTGLMKAAFGRETDEAIENARIYEEGEGRSLLWGAEAAAAAEAAKRAAEMAEADAEGAQAGNEEAREAAEIAEEAAETAEAEEAADPDGAAGAAPAATETTVKVVTSFAPEALYRDATGKTMIVDPGAFTRPGGAYEDGAFGPEQILCSESNLYPILVAHKRDFYDKNRDYRRGSLFTDRLCTCPRCCSPAGAMCAAPTCWSSPNPSVPSPWRTTVPNASATRRSPTASRPSSASPPPTALRRSSWAPSAAVATAIPSSR